MAKNKQSDLPVIDPINATLEGELILSEPRLELGKSEIIVEKTLQKYEISDSGDIGKKVEIDTTDWDIKSEFDFEITLSQKRIVKMKFVREPKALQHFIGLTSVIYSTLFEVTTDARTGDTKVTAKMGGFEYIIQDEISSWIQMACDLVLGEGEVLNVDSAVKFFMYYNDNNSQIKKQAFVFLARPRRIQE